MREQLFSIPIDWLTADELDRRLAAFMINRHPHQIGTVNSEFIVETQTNIRFREALQSTDLNVPDGTGVVLAQTFQDLRYNRWPWLGRLIAWLILGFRHVFAPESIKRNRIIGVDLSDLLIRFAHEHNHSVYLLGGKIGVAEDAAKVWHKKYPNANFVGLSADNPLDSQTIQNIDKAKPDILLVACGAPKQDLFIFDHKQELKVPIMVGVGGTLDYISGRVIRAPRWIRRLGLEWLFRLFLQPKRFARIWRATATFSKLVLANK